MEIPIPEKWLKPILHILRTGDFAKQILVPRGVGIRWDSDSLGAFLGDVREPLIKALSVAGVMGKLIMDQPETGETYAFWFLYDNRKFYGKICLYNNKIQIKLLSAHRPNKGEERL